MWLLWKCVLYVRSKSWKHFGQEKVGFRWKGVGCFTFFAENILYGKNWSKKLNFSFSENPFTNFLFKVNKKKPSKWFIVVVVAMSHTKIFTIKKQEFKMCTTTKSTSNQLNYSLIPLRNLSTCWETRCHNFAKRCH
jgi:hypothetical protein